MNETVVFRNELGGYSTPYNKDTLARLYYELQKGNERLTAENAELKARLEKEVTQKVASYVQGKFGKILCMDCQKEAKKEENEVKE